MQQTCAQSDKQSIQNVTFVTLQVSMNSLKSLQPTIVLASTVLEQEQSSPEPTEFVQQVSLTDWSWKMKNEKWKIEMYFFSNIF